MSADDDLPADQAEVQQNRSDGRSHRCRQHHTCGVVQHLLRPVRLWKSSESQRRYSIGDDSTWSHAHLPGWRASLYQIQNVLWSSFRAGSLQHVETLPTVLHRGEEMAFSPVPRSRNNILSAAPWVIHTQESHSGGRYWEGLKRQNKLLLQPERRAVRAEQHFRDNKHKGYYCPILVINK